jgi:hypothetical protein
VVELYGASLVGSGGAYLELNFYTGAFSLISSVFGGYFDSSSGGLPAYLPNAQVIQTPNVVIPAGTSVFDIKLDILGGAGSTFTLQIGNFEIRKVGQ